MRVLSGNFDQADLQFGASRGSQCTAMATVAVCLAYAEDLGAWTANDVDRCLELGDHLYIASVSKLKEENKFVNAHLRPSELTSEITANQNLKMLFCVKENEEIFGTLMNETDLSFPAYELGEGIKKMLSTSKGGVISSNGYSMGIAKIRSRYWFFDSHRRGTDGLYAEEGKAVLIEFDNEESIANHIRNLFLRNNREYTLTPLEIQESNTPTDEKSSKYNNRFQSESTGKETTLDEELAYNSVKIVGDSNLNNNSKPASNFEKKSSKRKEKRDRLRDRLALARATKKAKQDASKVQHRTVLENHSTVIIIVDDHAKKSVVIPEKTDLSGNINNIGKINNISLIPDKPRKTQNSGNVKSRKHMKSLLGGSPNEIGKMNDFRKLNVDSKMSDISNGANANVNRTGESNITDTSNNSLASSVKWSGSNNKEREVRTTRCTKKKHDIAESKLVKKTLANKRLKEYKLTSRYKEQNKQREKEKYENNPEYKVKKVTNNQKRLQNLEIKAKHSSDIRKYLQNVKYKHRHLAKKRLENPKIRAQNLSLVKERLQNPEIRARNLSLVKERLQNPEIRARNLSLVKERLQNPQLKARNKERLLLPEIKNNTKTKRRERVNRIRNDDRLKKKEYQSTVEYLRKKRLDKNSSNAIYENFKKNIREGPTNICICCGQLFFNKSVRNISEKNRIKIETFCTEKMKNRLGCKICLTCLNYINRNKTPPTALRNGLDLPLVPAPLIGLTALEERLVSARIPFIKIKELGAKEQYGLQGHCINVPIDINDTVHALPRLPSEDGTVAVQLMRRIQDKNPYMYANVRPEKVKAAAQYLVGTDLYKSHNITLRDNWEEEMEREFLEAERNAVNAKVALSERDDVWGETLTEEEAAIQAQETLLTSTFLNDSGIKIAPGEGNKPMSLIKDSDLDVLAFPSTYGAEVRKFKVPLTPVQIAKAEVRCHDRRIASNISLLFLRFCLVRVYRLVSKINIALRKKKTSKKIKAADVVDNRKLQDLMDHDEGFRIISVDRASPAYWEGKKKTVFAMIRQFGKPTFFFTISAAETKWLELIVILSEVVDKKIISEEEADKLPWQERVRLIKADPVTCARYFDHKFNELMKLIMHENGPFAPYRVKHYFLRYEVQKRGSLHVHLIIWIFGAPMFDPCIPESKIKCEKFMDTFITCKKDESLGDVMNRQYHKHTKSCQRKRQGIPYCRFNFPKPPMRKTNILFPLTGEFSANDIKKYRELYKTMVENSEKIAKFNENISFDAYITALNVTEDEYIFAIRSTIAKPTPFYERQLKERYINVYNLIIFKNFKSNMDIQFILDAYETAGYVNSYVTKSQYGMSRLLQQVQEMVRKGDYDLMTRLRKIINAFLNNSEISAQEVVVHLLGIPMAKCSVGQVFINTLPIEKRVQLMKSKLELEVIFEADPDSEDIFVAGPINRYVQRPDELDSVCLADFVAQYTFSKKRNSSKKDKPYETDSENEEFRNGNNSSMAETHQHLAMKDKSGFVSKRKSGKLIRYCRFDKKTDELNYFREQIMLFTAWRIEPTGDLDLKIEFFRLLPEIEKNRKSYCHYDDILDNLEKEDSNNLSDDEEEESAFYDFRINELNDAADISVELPNEMNAPSEERLQTFRIPKLVNDAEYITLISKLNEKQKKFLLDVANVVKTNVGEQKFVFISGAAGVGKSVLINAITQTLSRYWIHQIDNDPSDIHLMLVAATGRAAYNIKGTTIHQAFQFGYMLKKELARSRKLSSDVRNSLHSKYRALKVLIIDEISLVGATMFQAINRALQDIFGSNKPFGGISLFVFGDLNQLQPVNDGWIFEKPKDVVGGLIGSYLWSYFELYELTEIMRQKDDALFAAALTNLATGNTTEQDNRIFEARQISTLNLELTDIMNAGAVALFHKNSDVDLCNEVMLAAMPSKGCVSMALDQLVGKHSNERRKDILAQFKARHHTNTQGLFSNIVLKIGAKYVLSSNLEVGQGLTNGTPCILKHIVWGELEMDKTLVPLRVYVHFDDPSIGEQARQNAKQYMLNEGISLDWTPIERICRTMQFSAGSMSKITRNQFPLKPAFAMTIHTSQGSTQTKLVVDVTGLTRRLMYTALSRVTTPEGLFIKGVFKPPAKASPNDKVVKEMRRMREENTYKFKLTFPEHNGVTKVVYHNVRSLVKYLDYVKRDVNYYNCDIIMLAETRTTCTSDINLEGYIPIQRADGIPECKHAYGALVYVKTNMRSFVNVFHDVCFFSTLQDNTYCVNITGLIIKQEGTITAIISIYRSPKCKLEIFLTLLEEALGKINTIDVDNVFVVGDFNINYLNMTAERTLLLEFMATNSLILVNKKDPTTDSQSLIDMCFSKLKPLYCHVTESVISDHKPLWFSLQ